MCIYIYILYIYMHIYEHTYRYIDPCTNSLVLLLRAKYMDR